MRGEDRVPPERPKSLALLGDEPLVDVVRYVELAYSPSVHAYHTLKNQIEQSSPKWLSKFLELGGFDAFLDTLCQLAGHKFTNFSDAVLQLDCLSCIKAVLNTNIGMQFCIQNEDGMRKLMQAVDTPNTLPKKQILELVTAVAMFCRQGHDALMCALETFKRDMNYEHKFSIIVNELKNSETATYRITLMSLINVILRGHPEVKERSWVREQFIALRLLDVISFIRKDDREPELAIQLEIFDSDKHVDDQQLMTTHGVDINSHNDLFLALYNQIFCTPSSGYLLHVLQDLYHMETSSCVHHSEEKWLAISKVVKLIVSMKGDTECTDFINKLPKKGGSKSRPAEAQDKRSGNLNSKPNNPENVKVSHRRTRSDVHVVPDGDTRPHYPLEDSGQSKGGIDRYSDSSEDKGRTGGSGTRRDVNRQDSGISITSTYDNMSTMEGLFRRQGSGRSSFGARERAREVAVKPQKPVKDVKWSPLRAKDAYKPLSVWKIIQEKTHKKSLSLNFKALEDEFVQTHTEGITDVGDEVHLLDHKESLQLNLLLARLEAMPEELADSVLQCDPSDLNPHSVELLLAAMPSEHQMSRIRQYEGPRFTLAPAEQFLGFMCENKNYPILLEGLQFKVNFIAQFPKLKSAFEAMITSCRDILHHFGLRDFIKTMLEAGNFLNSGNDLEPVAGVKLHSWKAIAEVKGKDHHSNLLDFLVRHIQHKDEEVLSFLDDFPALEKAASYSLDELKKEVTELNLQLKQFLQQLTLVKHDLMEHFQEFVEEVKSELACLHGSIARLRGLSSQMALYVCEDEVNFDLQTCLKKFYQFILLVKTCRKDGTLLNQQRAAAVKRQDDLRRKAEDAHMMKFFGKKADLCSSFARAQSDPLVDHILDQIHQGNMAYHQEEEPKTPDSDNQLLISVIPRLISTPVDNLDCDLESDSFIFQGAANPGRKTYVDRVEAIIDGKYHREKQMESGSFLNQGKLKALQQNNAQFIPPANKDFQIKIYPKLPGNPPLPCHRPKGKGHQRNFSDFDHSRIADKKWAAYENNISDVKVNDRASEDNMESRNVLMSLGLEKDGKVLRDLDLANDDIEDNKTPDIDSKPTNPKKKRVSLFQRFSQAVLRQRNTNVMEDVKGPKGNEQVIFKDLARGSKRWSGRARKSKKNVDKENIKIDFVNSTEI